MHRMIATVTVTSSETRILVQDGLGEDQMIARLPPIATAHRWALQTLLESLALWTNTPVHVVLYADETYEWERLGLLDALGFESDGLHINVEIIPCPSRPGSSARAKWLRGMGGFAQERRRLRVAGK